MKKSSFIYLLVVFASLYSELDCRAITGDDYGSYSSDYETEYENYTDNDHYYGYQNESDQDKSEVDCVGKNCTVPFQSAYSYLLFGQEEKKNCIDINMSDSTEEINSCCKILDLDSVSDITSPEFQRCADVLFSAKLQRNLDFNAETAESLSRSNSRCVIDSLDMLKILLCTHDSCDSWKSILLRSLCKVCYTSSTACYDRKIH